MGNRSTTPGKLISRLTGQNGQENPLIEKDFKKKKRKRERLSFCRTFKMLQLINLGRIFSKQRPNYVAFQKHQGTKNLTGNSEYGTKYWLSFWMLTTQHKSFPLSVQDERDAEIQQSLSHKILLNLKRKQISLFSLSCIPKEKK